MTLRGQPPNDSDRRAKVLLFGPPSTGKTFECLEFDNLYYIDTERGAVMPEYVKKMREKNTAYVFIDDYYGIVDEVRSLTSTDHQYHTLAIDPLTTVFNAMIEESTRRLSEFRGVAIDDPELAEFGKDRKMANMRIRQLAAMLTRLDMNVIITCHAKAEFKTDKSRSEKLVFDCYGKLDHMFDLVFELSARGDKRMATVRKTRHENFKMNETFEWTHDVFVERYGREVLERKAVAVDLASQEDVARLQKLLKQGESFTIKDTDKKLVTERDLSTWLARAGVEDWNDAKADHVTKLISFLEKKMEQ